MFRFDAEVWLYTGNDGWTIGATSWTTSVFPDKLRGAYVLPVKKDVRRAEELPAGDRVDATVELLDA